MNAGARRLAAAARVIDYCREVFPVRGLIVSPDIERAFVALQGRFPELTIHRYPSGSIVEDWEVPLAWEAVDGVLEDESCRLLAGLQDSFLFVAPYSEPVDGWFTKNEVAAHARTAPSHSGSFSLEHRNAYNYQLVDWGITLPLNVVTQMSNSGRYHVRIHTRTTPGNLCVAEAVLPGRRPEMICICSQFDELCNDGQASAVFAAELFRWLGTLPNRQFTYQLLLVPELVGTLFFASSNREQLGRTVAMLDLETLGAGERWVLKRGLGQRCSLEQALKIALRDLNADHRVCGFFEGYGNDERVYGWPTIGIPGPALQRYPFSEYHTDLDTPDILDRALLEEAFTICERTLLMLEKNHVPAFTTFLPPWLTKHGLYVDAAMGADAFRMNNELLFGIDGTRSLLSLCDELGLPFEPTEEYLRRFVEKGLVKTREPTFEELRTGG